MNRLARFMDMDQGLLSKIERKRDRHRKSYRTLRKLLWDLVFVLTPRIQRIRRNGTSGA